MNLKVVILCFLFSHVWLSALYGVPKGAVNETEPALYYADSQTYDRELGILILKGHVEFEHQGSLLEADYVTYNENTDIVTASGNVRIRQATGDINFAEYVELTGDMKDGIVLQMRGLMEDNSKIAAVEGRKFEDREELDRAVYTPCEICGDMPPTWQINARRALKDDVNKDIHFTDAEMRILDVPILYLPYAKQPLERRSGFLIPRPNYSTDFGSLIEIPYFIALSEDKDITLSPVFFTQQNPLLLGQYRQRWGNGFFKGDGSITQFKKSAKDKKQEKIGGFEIPEKRGHLYGLGKLNLTDIWRLDFAGGIVSDETYFRKFGFTGWQNATNLFSKAILEGFLNQRDYAATKVYHFRGFQRTDQQKSIAAVLPLMEYNSYSGVDPLGGRFTFGGNLLNLTRQKGIEMQRGIGELGWQRPWMVPFGQVFTVFGSTRGDYYKVENTRVSSRVPSIRKAAQEKKGGGRFFPQAGIDWRWPFINSYEKQSVVLQPLGELIAAPDKAIGVEARRIPNEDSADFEFNDANLFSPDRITGYDVIDTGSRAVYGGQILTTGSLFGDIEAFLGQSYSFSEPKRTDAMQGLGRRLSDYVGRFEASPMSSVTLNYRFRLDQKSLNPRVSEVGGSIGPEIARLSGDYVFISKDAGTADKKDFKQVNLTLTSQVTKYWSITGTLIQNLRKKKEGGGPLAQGVGIVYRDDCFGVGFRVLRQFYKDRDLRPATLVMMTLFLKHIGDYQWAFNVDQGLFGEKAPEEVQRPYLIP